MQAKISVTLHTEFGWVAFDDAGVTPAVKCVFCCKFVCKTGFLQDVKFLKTLLECHERAKSILLAWQLRGSVVVLKTGLKTTF